MTKSFTDSVRFTADSLISRQVISEELRTKIIAFATSNAVGEAKEAYEKELLEDLTPEAKTELAKFGAKMPYDVVEVKLNFNDFLFVLYEAGSIRPTAPLAIAAHQGRLQKFAIRLQKDEFLLDTKESEVIKKVLEDDKKWAEVSFPGYVEVQTNDEEKTLTGVALTSSGVSFYGKILNEAVKMFGDKDESEVAETAV